MGHWFRTGVLQVSLLRVLFGRSYLGPAKQSVMDAARAEVHNLCLSGPGSSDHGSDKRTLILHDPEAVWSGNIVYARLIFHQSDHSIQHE